MKSLFISRYFLKFRWTLWCEWRVETLKWNFLYIYILNKIYFTWGRDNHYVNSTRKKWIKMAIVGMHKTPSIGKTFKWHKLEGNCSRTFWIPMIMIIINYNNYYIIIIIINLHTGCRLPTQSKKLRLHWKYLFEKMVSNS